MYAYNTVVPSILLYGIFILNLFVFINRKQVKYRSFGNLLQPCAVVAGHVTNAVTGWVKPSDSKLGDQGQETIVSKIP